MRRVERGPWPKDADGKKKAFHPYNKAKRDLLDRLGDYCSYCERTGDLHVEHVVPKVREPTLSEEWTNFLLACANCNSTKGDRNHSRVGFVWPDTDDTDRAFEYSPDGIVRVRRGLPGHLERKAEALYDLVGLGRRPGRDAKASDLRWLKRRRAWGQATEARRRIENGADVHLVIELAKAVGFWSVWMTVFANNTAVRDGLTKSFPGTR